jgi:hypothetical protein
MCGTQVYPRSACLSWGSLGALGPGTGGVQRPGGRAAVHGTAPAHPHRAAVARLRIHTPHEAPGRHAVAGTAAHRELTHRRTGLLWGVSTRCALCWARRGSRPSAAACARAPRGTPPRCSPSTSPRCPSSTRTTSCSRPPRRARRRVRVTALRPELRVAQRETRKSPTVGSSSLVPQPEAAKTPTRGSLQTCYHMRWWSYTHLSSRVGGSPRGFMRAAPPRRG